ncbi:MAG TPA: sugar transferase [Gemmatimonadaceae bacterium]|nr:sugar transferase [Gemmatimonadaceae bacterium]
MSRAALRVCALLIVDCAAFLLLRTVVRGLRMFATGGAQGDFIHWLFADGYLGGWQYAAALLLALLTRGTYGAGDGRRDPGRILAACALATALPLWASLWTQPLLQSAGQYVLTVPPAFVVILAFRLLLDQAIVKFAPHPSAGTLSRAILVGHAGECIDMRGRRALTERGGIEVLGFVDVLPQATRGSLGTIDALEALLLEHRADTLILCGPVDDNAVMNVMRAARTTECQVLTAARRFELAGIVPSIVWRRGQPFIMLRRVGLRWQQLVLKRLLDITVSAIALVILSPLMLLIAAAVRLESKGPAFFKQRRVGRHGRSFGCFKFRSMYTDAEKRLRDDPQLYRMYVENDYKLPEEVDTRVTRVGRFLRQTSLDELPQLWNVLKGEMSLVGPRPIVPNEIRHYNGEATLLLTLQPGITGAWQVSGRSTLQYPERATVELEYVEQWSLLSDLWILLRTVPAVLTRRGAH